MTDYRNPYCSVAASCSLPCEPDDEPAEPEYYDDEELDAYRGVAPSAYTAGQVAEFEEVMTTMRPDEVHGWLRSLAQRGVELPDALRDAALMLITG